MARGRSCYCDRQEVGAGNGKAKGLLRDGCHYLESTGRCSTRCRAMRGLSAVGRGHRTGCLCWKGSQARSLAGCEGGSRMRLGMVWAVHHVVCYLTQPGVVLAAVYAVAAAAAATA